MVEIAQVVGSADRNLVEKWNAKFSRMQQARMNFEQQWLVNLNFYFDRQWIVVSNKGVANGGFVINEAKAGESWRVRHTANRCKRVIRAELTKLSKEEPQFWSVPDSTAEADRAAAFAADSLADWIMHNKYFNMKRSEATFWACMTGTSFLKNWYDPDKIELDGKLGKIDFDAVTSFHLFVPNLQVVDVQAQPHVIHAKAMSPEDAFNQFGRELQPQGTSSTIIDQRFMSSIGVKQGQMSGNEMVYVKEVWVKPCREFPQGAMFVISDQELLYVFEPTVDPTVEAMELGEGDEEAPVEAAPTVQFDLKGMSEREYEFPYRHGRYPFAKIDHIPTGMFYAESVLKAFIPLQKEYNRTRSLMLETRNLAGKPQWAYTKGSIEPKHFTSKPGLLLAVNLSFDPPKALEQPQLPPSVANEVQFIQADMDDVTSQFEISKGRTPPGVEAASAIAFLQEENDTILHHTIVSLEAAIQETGVQVLANAHDFWSEERIVEMTSKNQSYEVKRFKGAMIKPWTDFRVSAGSMAPRSTAAKQAFITELLKLGVIPFAQAAKYLQMSETTKMYEDLMLDDRHAMRENMKMSDGNSLEKVDPSDPQPNPETGITEYLPKMTQEVDEMGMPTVDPNTGQPVAAIVTTNSFDNHEAHIRVHTDYMKTEEYELLPVEIQQIFEDHVNEHKTELLKERSALDNYNNAQNPEQPLENGSTDQSAANPANGEMANA